MAALLYLFCTALPSHIIPFALIWNFRWQSRTLALALVAGNVLCQMAVATYLYCQRAVFPQSGADVCGSRFLICCLLRLKPFKMPFTYLQIVDYLLIVREIVSVLAVQVLHIPIQGWSSSIVCILFYGVTLPLLPQMFRQVANLVYCTDAPRLWRIIWQAPAFVSILALISTNSYLENSVDSVFFLFWQIAPLVCAFPIYYVLLPQFLEDLEQQTILRQRLIFKSRLLETQISEQKTQLANGEAHN